MIVTDIFSAREKDPGTVSGKSMAALFSENGLNALHMSDFDEIAQKIRTLAKQGDIVITLGAGDVNQIIAKIIS